MSQKPPPPDQEQYTPPESPSSEGASAYEVTGARNPLLNGQVSFRYPGAFDEVRIGTRMAQLARANGVAFTDLPRGAAFYAEAIATLERCIHTAPEGWYSEAENGKPVLDVGSIGSREHEEGDEEIVLEVYFAFLRYKARFRARAETPGDARETETVVPGSETERQPAEGDPH